MLCKRISLGKYSSTRMLAAPMPLSTSTAPRMGVVAEVASLPPRSLDQSHPLAEPASICPPRLEPGPKPPSPATVLSYHDDIEYTLFTEEQLKRRILDLGAMLARDYADKQPLVLGVLTGAFQFTGDLVRAMEPCPRGTTVNFVRASSYGSGTASSGQVQIKVDIDPARVKGRHILLVEDIVDTGLTLTRLRAYMLEQCGAASCKIVALLDKKERRKVHIEPEYVGFACPNEFVVGYGLDFDEEYRTLPYIGVLRPECYAHKLG